jgi:hypothetical protein
MPATKTVLLPICLCLFAVTSLHAQSSAPAQTMISGSDQAAATSTTKFVYRILPAATPAAKKLPATALTNVKLASKAAALPQPGFFPADLSYHGGPVIRTAKNNPVYFDCPAGPTACWGDPATFLRDLNHSVFVHLADQYIGSTATLRYPLGNAVSINQTLQTNVLGQNDILAIVHAAAAKLSVQNSYSNIFHVFLPRGVDTCFDLTSICYSPDNPSSFFFCAYHGAVWFNDIGHILFSVEPYQNVPGCQVATPTPNGALVDSTASVLSHEFFETITDPDLNAWFSEASLIEWGEEIADICEPIGNAQGQFLDPVFLVNGKNYKIQLEYSNKFHACTHQ